MQTVRLTMAQALVRYLVAQRTEIDGENVPVFAGVFGIFGHGNVTCLAEALEPVQDQLPTWRGHNEQSMALAAVAFAKAKRRRQMMIATSSIGPGSTNMVTAAAVAHSNRLPLLLLSGDTFSHRIVDPVLQQVEHFDDPTLTVTDAFKPVTRYWDRITRPEQLLQTLPQALGTLLDPADCGPVFLGRPQDVQAEAFDYPVEFFEPTTHYIRRARADDRDIARAAELLAGAQKPLIISGGGVHYSGAVAELTAFAEQRAIPVVETVAGKATLVHEHPNFCGAIGVTGTDAANAVADQADVVVAIGTRLQDFTTGSWSVFANPDVSFITINVARFDALKRRHAPVVADAQTALADLDAALDDYRAPGDWLPWSRQQLDDWDVTLDHWRTRTDIDPPAYQQVIQRINELAADDDYCLAAAGGLPGELTMGWRSKSIGSFDCEYGYSCMGYEVAGAWGAKMARPDTDVLCWVGDGSYLMMNSDVYASVASGHKLILLMCDNGGFAVINRLQVNMGGAEFNNLLASSRHTTDARVDFVAHIESMGATAEKVTSLDDIPAAFERAKAAEHTYALVFDIHPYEWTDGGAWWEVGVPEVSDRDAVLVARAELEAGKKNQRLI